MSWPTPIRTPGIHMDEVNDSFIDAAGSVYRSIKEKRPRQYEKFIPKKFSIAQIETMIFLAEIRGITRATRNVQALPAASRELARRRREIGIAAPSSFRWLIKMLESSKALRDALELRRVPCYSTLYKAKKRLGYDFQDELVGFVIHI